MKFVTFRKVCLAGVLIALCVSAGASKKKDKTVTQVNKTVDSGSLGVYVSGKRVATETFRIEQGESFSTATSEFKTADGMAKARQESELQIGTNGELRRYTWRELAPGKSQITVEPSGEFLVEHVTPDPPEKPSDQTLLLSTSTSILDDYFFSQRELLMWRYMAQACGAQIQGCSLPSTIFGALIPSQRISVSVAVSYKGKEKVSIKGITQELDRFEVSVEGDEWRVYLDSNMKMVRIVVPAENTEVLRD